VLVTPSPCNTSIVLPIFLRYCLTVLSGRSMPGDDTSSLYACGIISSSSNRNPTYLLIAAQSWILMPLSPSTSTSNLPLDCIFTSTIKRSSLSAIFSSTNAVTVFSIECATPVQTTNHEKRGLQLSPLSQDDAKINK